MVTRVLNANDGTSPATWRYSPTCSATLGTVNTVTDPLGNDSVYTFGQGNYETQRQIYQGGRSTGTLLKTVNTDYSFYTVPSGAPDSISRVNVVPIRVTTIWPTGQQSKIERDYDSGFAFTHPDPVIVGTFPGTFGKVLAVRRFDWGPGSPGGMLQQTVPIYQWQVNTTYLNAHLLDLPASVITRDGAGTQAARVDFGYDDPARLIASGITTQHGLAPQAVRGNLTSLSRWLNTTGGAITSFTDWLDTGMISRQIDPLGHATTYSYSSTFAGAYLTQTQFPNTSSPNPASHIISRNYDFNTGLLTSATDENNRTTSYAYDTMFRLTSTNLPDGGATNFSYPDAITIEQKQKIDPTRWSDLFIKFDGLGRTSRTAGANGEPSPALPWDQVDTCYDGLGRKTFVTYPYRDNGFSVAKSCSNSARAGDSFTYDALNRTTQVTRTDGGTAVTSYPAANQAIVTDEAGKKRKSQSDALGRLTNVWEPDAAGSFIFETAYQYDTLNNLTRVDQKGNDSNTANWRTRTFAYDSLSRLTSANNPESGTVSYQYDNDGNLVSKTDARSITINHSYDALHRLSGKTYSNGEPAVNYSYDQASFNGLTISNGTGRRTGMQDVSGQTAWTYDAMGRALTERRTIGTLTKSMGYTYNLDGSIATIIYPNPSSNRTITYAYNTAQRPVSAIDTANSINYATNARYAAFGALSSLVTGSTATSGGVNRTLTYNSRLQPLRTIAQAAGATSAVFDLSYDFHLGAGDNGNVFQITNNRDNTRTQSFTYDQLNRLTTAQSQATSGANCWGESFGYDIWANLTSRTVTKCGAEGPLPAATTKNQMAGSSYDAAGNLLTGGYTYDAENRITGAGGVTYTYDGDGNRVKKSSGPLYWRGMQSDALSESDLSGAVTREFIFFNGQRIAFRTSAQQYRWNLTDHLGSTRKIISAAAGNTYDDADFFPFGGERQVITSSSGNNYKFTGNERDAESGNDYTETRHYGSGTARFLQPDELFVDQEEANPQSWNLYAYTLNNPLRYTDPDGQAHTDTSGFLVGDYPGECGIPFDICWNAEKQIWEAPPTESASSDKPDAIVTADPEPVDQLNPFAQAVFSQPSLQIAGATMNDPRTYALWLGASAVGGAVLVGTGVIGGGGLITLGESGLLANDLTAHAVGRLAAHGITPAEARAAVEAAKQAGTFVQTMGRYGPQIRYVANGIKVVVATTGANAGKIITAFHK